MPDDKITQMMLDGIAQVSADVRDLNKKVDTKFDLIHSRITKESSTSHDRVTLLAEMHVKACADLEATKARVNWLYVIVGGLFLTLAGTVFGIITKGV
jgi:hypothetical protein